MIAISKYNKQHPLRVFEAFAGYGSQSLAFKYLKDKHPEFDFKIGKRISKAHKAMFTNKTMVIWYKGNPIIGTMHDGLWYQQDLNGMLEPLMFQSEVTHVSFLPSPNEDRERKNPSHHR